MPLFLKKQVNPHDHFKSSINAAKGYVQQDSRGFIFLLSELSELRQMKIVSNFLKQYSTLFFPLFIKAVTTHFSAHGIA